jgi:colicin import membrane protein
MNNNSKKKFIVTIKVIIVHIFLILILDLNAISNLKKNKNSFNEINNAQFLNLKSISQEDIEEYRKLIRKKKAEEKKKRKIEADRKKKAEEKKKRKIEADRKKKEILENLKKEEEIDLINHDRLELEKELLEMEKYELLVRQQIIRNSQLSDAEAKYILNIKSRIENNWLLPHDIKHDKICTAIVNQLPSGKITNVKIHGCTGDTLYVDSLINAVWKSSPLPIAPDIEVFQENLILQFKGPN